MNSLRFMITSCSTRKSAPSMSEMPKPNFFISHFPKESFVQNPARMRKICFTQNIQIKQGFQKNNSAKVKGRGQRGFQGALRRGSQPPLKCHKQRLLRLWLQTNKRNQKSGKRKMGGIVGESRCCLDGQGISLNNRIYFASKTQAGRMDDDAHASQPYGPDPSF